MEETDIRRKQSLLWDEPIKEVKEDNQSSEIETHDDDNNTQRKSKPFTEVSGARRNSLLAAKVAMSMRRGSINKMSSSKYKSNKNDSQLIDELIKRPSRPSLFSGFSPEAQFALMQCYETKMRNMLEKNSDPGVKLSRSASPSNSNIRVKQFGDYYQALFESRLENSTIDSAASSVNPPKTIETKRHSFDNNSQSEIPYDRQLLLTRRMQIAHSLLDYISVPQDMKKKLDASELNATLIENIRDCARTTPKQFRIPANSIDPIPVFNWWTNTWTSEFEVKKIEN